VRFDLDQNTAHSPDLERQRGQRRRRRNDEPIERDLPPPAADEYRDEGSGRRRRPRNEDRGLDDRQGYPQDYEDDQDRRRRPRRRREPRDPGRDDRRDDSSEEGIIDNIKHGTGMTGGLLKTSRQNWLKAQKELPKRPRRLQNRQRTMGETRARAVTRRTSLRRINERTR